jgi:FMN phosphatase YigB (HAD superfamily)
VPSRLARAGYRIGIAGNQPIEAEAALHQLGLPVSFVASSAGWGMEKPSTLFYERIAVESASSPVGSPT